ncbi:hypothetical protein PINS_up001402 [Pythium insidiosum]|nr:hypothetical protein PINS_up001402 [Pythium insidiosum]
MRPVSMMLNACALVAVSSIALQSSTASARPMHSGLDYHRYLEERDAMAGELEKWMSKYGDAAEKNGWIPPTEARSAEEVKEDRMQRLHMSKDLVDDLKKSNPDAEFSLDSPFSLMTTEEFADYVKNAYVGGDEARRRLREANGAPQNQRAMEGEKDAGKVHAEEEPSWFSKLFQRKDNGNGRYSYSFSGNWNDWNNYWNNYWNNNNNNNQWGNNNQWNNNRRPVNPQPQPQPWNPQPAPQPQPAPRPRPSYNPGPAPGPAPQPAPRPNPQPGPVGPVAPDSQPDNGPAPAPGPSMGGDGKDWSSNKCMPAIQNQGSCGSCWAFAAVSAAETANCLKSGNLVKLSEQNVASCSTRNYGCSGGVPVWTFEHIQQQGICTLQDDPYTSGNGRLAGCNGSCNKVKIPLKGTKRLQGEQQLTQAIDQYPVVVAVAAGNNAWKQYRGGVLSSCDTTRLDHAVVAVGYDSQSFKIRNSWGARWGENGYVRIKRTGGNGVCGVAQDITHMVF